jgi:hypothetical protein
MTTGMFGATPLPLTLALVVMTISRLPPPSGNVHVLGVRNTAATGADGGVLGAVGFGAGPWQPTRARSATPRPARRIRLMLHLDRIEGLSGSV